MMEEIKHCHIIRQTLQSQLWNRIIWNIDSGYNEAERYESSFSQISTISINKKCVQLPKVASKINKTLHALGLCLLKIICMDKYTKNSNLIKMKLKVFEKTVCTKSQCLLRQHLGRFNNSY